MLLTGRRIGANEALRLKLVNRVVPRAELMTQAQKLASKIKAHSPLAVSYAKQAVVRGLDLGLEWGLELETRLADCLLSSTREC